MKVDARNYTNSHGTAPRGRGYWLFAATVVDGGTIRRVTHEFTGTYTAAKRSLPAGEWTVLP